MSLTIADSIAIKTLNKNTLLAGVGNELHLHTKDTNITNRILPTTLHGKVHGIEVGRESNQDKLLVYGEKEYLLLQCTQEYEFTPLHRGHLTDWISAGKFMLETNEFVLLTAHSIALRLEYCEVAKTCHIAQRSSCSDKSTLYCAAIHGESWLELICFGGNAFGELLIWQPIESKVLLQQRIAAHNGVIFSIDFNAEAHLLTTTSDDRSIRFWRVDQDTQKTWAKAKLTPLASGFGHVARVFQGRIVGYKQNIYAITVGEDSFVCVWRTNGELLHKCRQQFGATIWNFEYVAETKTIYTVGSTGNVLAFCLQEIFEKDLNKTTTKTILPALTYRSNQTVADHYVAKVKFLTQKILIGITNQNNLVYKQSAVEEWQKIDDFPGFKCTVFEVSNNLIAICGFKRVSLYKYTEATSLKFEKYLDAVNILNGIVRSFKFLSQDKFLVCDEGGSCILLNANGEKSWKEYSIDLPKCKEPWLTSAALLDMEYLIISNRQGNVFLYKWCVDQHTFGHIDTLKHLHGNLGATLIKPIDTNIPNAALFKSAGHDGSLKLLKLCKINSTLRIIKREIVPVAWVEMLDKRYKDFDILLGFNDNHFTVWSRLHDFILQLPCGGGHRCWDYCIEADDIHLVFIQNKQVFLHKFKLFQNAVISKQIQLPPRNMWHVKSCNVLVCIEEVSELQTTPITISAGDDNLIKISRYESIPQMSRRKLTQLNEIHSHISNIRALKVIRYGYEGDYLIFSGGGRAQLCVTKLNTKTLQVEELLNFTVTAQSNNVDAESTESFRFDPETRIMALDVILSPSTANDYEFFEIFLGCSDGFLRKYLLNTELQIKSVAEINYGRCILQIHLIDRLFLLVAATDGLIKFYNLQMNQIQLNLSHHTSGVNALDVSYDAGKQELQLLSGGDDQDVVYSRLSLNGDKAVPLVLETLHFSGIHTAQVTAAQLSQCGKYAFCSGVDQQLFKINLQTGAVVLEIGICVADVKGLQMCSADEMCFIYGCGLQVISTKC